MGSRATTNNFSSGQRHETARATRFPTTARLFLSCTSAVALSTASGEEFTEDADVCSISLRRVLKGRKGGGTSYRSACLDSLLCATTVSLVVGISGLVAGILLQDV